MGFVISQASLWYVTLLVAFSFVAGTVGSILGLGGGMLLVSGLTILLGIDIHAAIGASLISVVGTSVGAGMKRLRDPVTEVRLALILTIVASIGAAIGSSFADRVPPRPLYITFAIMGVISGWLMAWPRKKDMNSSAPSEQGPLFVSQIRLAVTTIIIGLTGFMNGLVGLGCGPIKVATLDRIMSLPIKVCAATSIMMIGISSAVSAGLLLKNGNVPIFLFAPVSTGSLFGAWLGSKLSPRIPNAVIRVALFVCLATVTAQMAWKGFT